MLSPECVCKDLVPDFCWQHGEQGRLGIVALDSADRSVLRDLSERTGLTLRSGGRLVQAMRSGDGFDVPLRA